MSDVKLPEVGDKIDGWELAEITPLTDPDGRIFTWKDNRGGDGKERMLVFTTGQQHGDYFCHIDNSFTDLPKAFEDLARMFPL